MAEFTWSPSVDAGCPLCGTSVDERGFVDGIADTLVKNVYGEVTGLVNITICAHCLEQMARMVGCMSKHETMEMAQRVMDTEEELEKTKDEVQSWTQRYQQLLDNLSGDLSAYLKEKDANNSIPTDRKSSSKSST